MFDVDRRYQVFVSSTYLDLRQEREEVIRALLELDCIPAGMELFPASDEERWELIRRVIDDCDYYIVIVGGRYGSMDEEGISYTEREYDYAISKSIPVLGFVHADPERIEVGKAEISTEAQEKLTAFRSKVEGRMCKMWTTPQDLGGAVSRSLVQQMKLRPGTGWVRGDRAMSAEAMEELAELRTLNAKLQAELAASGTDAPPEVEHLAQGDDAVEVDYTIARWGQVVGTGTWEYTWNRLLAVIGPLMFDEASEVQLKRRLDAELEEEVEGGLADELNEKFARYSGIHLRPSSFHAIKMQLAALKIIEKSIRQRSVKDSNTYWRLTPYGESLVFSLSAIPRGKVRPDWLDVEDNDEAEGDT